jgi:hypothetical protein
MCDFPSTDFARHILRSDTHLRPSCRATEQGGSRGMSRLMQTLYAVLRDKIKGTFCISRFSAQDRIQKLKSPRETFIALSDYKETWGL